MINACIYIHAYICIDDRITDACMPHRRAHVRDVHTCASTCVRAHMGVWVWAHTYPRRNVSTFHRRGPHVVRLAGVRLSRPIVGVQREHRRVEHRVSHHVVPGTRRFRPAARHRSGRARSVLCAARPLCSVALLMCARICVRTHV
jgi:hypothetical protein